MDYFPTSVASAQAMHAPSTSPVSPHTAPPRGTSMVVMVAMICAVAGGSDALLALEPLLWSEHGERR